MSEDGPADNIDRGRFLDKPQTVEDALLTQNSALLILRKFFETNPRVSRLLRWGGKNYELPLTNLRNELYSGVSGSIIVTPDITELSFSATRRHRASSDPKEEGFRFQRPAATSRGERGIETEHWVLTGEGQLLTTPQRDRVFRAPGSVMGSEAILRFARSFVVE